MRVLISGTTGWIGGELAKALHGEGHQVIGVSRRGTSIEGVTSLQADLTSKDLGEKLGDQGRFDVACHLAGSLGWCSLEQAVDINVGGTRRFVQAAIDAGCKKIVVASSVATIGTVAPNHPPSRLPMRPDHPFEGGSWAYALSKDMVEKVVRFMANTPENKGIDFILVRVGNTVTDPPEIKHMDGIVDGKEVSWLVEPATCRAEGPFSAAQPKVFPEAELCAVALSDQVACLLAAATGPCKPGLRCVACVAPQLYAVETVPALMRSWYGEAADRIDMAHYEQPGHERDPIYDLSAAKKELGWEPKVDLLESRPEARVRLQAALEPRRIVAGGAAAGSRLKLEVHVVVLKSVPEDAQVEWLRMAQELAEATWCEDGCLAYQFVRGAGETFVIVERWASQAHLDAHFESEHFRRLVPAMDGISETPGLHICQEALSTQRPPRCGRVLVLFDSSTTCTEQMAELVAEGARQVDHMEVRVRTVPGSDNHWDDKRVRQHHSPADFHDILWADGLACGSPTNLGCVSWRTKKFWDDFSQAGYWSRVDGKVGCAFSSVGGTAGGAEIVNMAMNAILMNFGFSCFGVTDYTDFKNTLHYGAVCAKAPRSEVEKMACRRLGRRLAEFVGFYICHRPEVHPLLASKAVDWERWEAPIPPKGADEQELAHLNSQPFRGPRHSVPLSTAALTELPRAPQAGGFGDSSGGLLPTAAEGSRKKAFIFTRMAGYIHESTPAAAAFLATALGQRGWAPLVSSDPALLQIGTAGSFDLIILANCTGEFMNPEHEALTTHLKEGKPLLGLHACLASFLGGDEDPIGGTYRQPTTPLMKNIFGTHFLNHPVPQKGTVLLNRNAGPLWSRADMLGGLPESFSLTDEFFNFSEDPVERLQATPLASMDPKSYEGKDGSLSAPIVWCLEWGPMRAKIFYCGLGHFDSHYEEAGLSSEPSYVTKILCAGLNYVIGK